MEHSQALNSRRTMGGRSVDLRPRQVMPNGRAASTRSPANRRGLATVRAAAVSDKDRVVITGQGIASVFGNNVDTFYNSLLEGRSGVGQITRFDASDFPTTFAAQIKDLDIEGLVDKKNARRYDDCILYSLISAKKVLKDTGLEKGSDAYELLDKTPPGKLIGGGNGRPTLCKALIDAGLEKGSDAYEKLDKTRAGVLIGSGMGGLTVFQDGVKNLVEKGYKKITPFFIPYAITNMGGALVAIDTGFMGPNYSISTACATANYAFVAAANHIRRGEADVILVGGSEAPIIPVGLGGFVACRALSSRSSEPERASRPWDKGRDGFVMGEGAGVLVMESYKHATERGANILAEYLGGAITCDAYHMTDPRADGLGVSTCIELALKDAGIEKEQVNYINAHATSTLVGDVAEVKAIKKVFTDMSHVKVNGTKSLIGHCLGAAGGLEAVATIQAIRTGWLHPTLNQEDLVDEVADIDTVPNEKKQHEVTAAISNSFGFGGHNSVVVFGPYKG